MTIKKYEKKLNLIERLENMTRMTGFKKTIDEIHVLLDELENNCIPSTDKKTNSPADIVGFNALKQKQKYDLSIKGKIKIESVDIKQMKKIFVMASMKQIEKAIKTGNGLGYDIKKTN